MSKERWIMVADGTPQIFYVGKTTLDDDKISFLAQKGMFLDLEDARAMRTIVLPTPQGVSQSNMLTPVSICRGGFKLRVKPTSYFWPDEDEETMAALNKQLEQCDSSEIKHRAEKAGIHIAGAGAVTPDGMRIPDDGRAR